jgi:Dehydratase family
VALITDGRFSGGSHGVLIGYIMPEVMEGGPIALVEDGDVIEIDEESRALNLLVEPEVLLVRRGKWEVGEKMEPRLADTPVSACHIVYSSHSLPLDETGIRQLLPSILCTSFCCAQQSPCRSSTMSSVLKCFISFSDPYEQPLIEISYARTGLYASAYV